MGATGKERERFQLLTIPIIYCLDLNSLNLPLIIDLKTEPENTFSTVIIYIYP
jgi:hypothetical protein